jgi:hypothetical protein
MSDELRTVTIVANRAEAEIVCARLLADGIRAITQRTTGSVEFGDSGGRTVMVAVTDLERARALLASEEGTFSDEELTRLSEEAGGKAPES